MSEKHGIPVRLWDSAHFANAQCKPATELRKARRSARVVQGCTNDKRQRLITHNRGLVKSTKHRRPFELVYFEKSENFKAARKREVELKKMKGGIQFKELLKKSARVVQLVERLVANEKVAGSSPVPRSSCLR